METLELTSYAIGAGAALVAGLLKLYHIGYARGYEAGYADSEHCGLCGFREIREPLYQTRKQLTRV